MKECEYEITLAYCDGKYPREIELAHANRYTFKLKAPVLYMHNSDWDEWFVSTGITAYQLYKKAVEKVKSTFPGDFINSTDNSKFYLLKYTSI